MAETLRRSGPSDAIPGTRPASDPPPVPAAPANSPGAPDADHSWARRTLREIGLGVTGPRVLVLSALRGRERPVTAQDLHRELAEQLREDGGRTGAPGVTTMYRALAALTEHGLLHCFPQGRGVTAYRLCPPARHHHLMCRSCGRVQEQRFDPEPDWLKVLNTPGGFAVEDCHADLVGLCARCQRT